MSEANSTTHSKADSGQPEVDTCYPGVLMC